jgi:hypothetical protein
MIELNGSFSSSQTVSLLHRRVTPQGELSHLSRRHRFYVQFVLAVWLESHRLIIYTEFPSTANQETSGCSPSQCFTQFQTCLYSFFLAYTRWLHQIAFNIFIDDTHDICIYIYTHCHIYIYIYNIYVYIYIVKNTHIHS